MCIRDRHGTHTSLIIWQSVLSKSPCTALKSSHVKSSPPVKPTFLSMNIFYSLTSLVFPVVRSLIYPVRHNLIIEIIWVNDPLSTSVETKMTKTYCLWPFQRYLWSLKVAVYFLLTFFAEYFRETEHMCEAVAFYVSINTTYGSVWLVHYKALMITVY